MDLHPKKLVTIVAEASIEKAIEEAVVRLGASGFTVGDVRGRGHGGARAGNWEHAGTTRIEIICTPAVADAIVAEVAREFLPLYSVVLHVHDVQVLRSDKF